jgi:hypothetical protein
MASEISIEDELRALMADASVDPSAAEPTESAPDPVEVTAPIDEEPKPDTRSRDASGKFAKAEAPVENPENIIGTETKPAAPDAPQAIPPAIRAKWGNLDPDVQQAILKREDEVHKMFTRHDGELNMGRKMKEVISPYMPLIHSEGGTPEGAVQNLLNTAYVLKTGSQEQKLGVIQHIARAYGIDLSGVNQQQAVPTAESEIVRLRQQLQQVQQQANPQTIMTQLREQIESDRVNQEVEAFAADPANLHFQTVKAEMAALLGNGLAKDLREAYDRAVWSNPATRSTRSTLTTAQSADTEAKRRAALGVKRQAAVSVTGSAGSPAGSTGAKPNQSIEAQLRELISVQEGRL